MSTCCSTTRRCVTGLCSASNYSVNIIGSVAIKTKEISQDTRTMFWSLATLVILLGMLPRSKIDITWYRDYVRSPTTLLTFLEMLRNRERHHMTSRLCCESSSLGNINENVAVGRKISRDISNMLVFSYSGNVIGTIVVWRKISVLQFWVQLLWQCWKCCPREKGDLVRSGPSMLERLCLREWKIPPGVRSM